MKNDQPCSHRKIPGSNVVLGLFPKMLESPGAGTLFSYSVKDLELI